jgi:hypothetical protein
MLDLHIKEGDHLEVETQFESGNPDKLKLYVHLNGVTILRVCKVNPMQLNVKLANEGVFRRS